nr:thiamine phosphate synthase [Paracoccus sanguinis]
MGAGWGGAPPPNPAPRLTAVLDAHPVACLRLSGAGDEAELARIADLAREIAHARDVAVVIEDHVALAARHGLDGVHLTQGARGVRHARKELGADAIVGAFCGASRHEGMNAGEAGADYVSFGPLGPTALGPGTPVDLELLQWWSEVIEVPVVAEGALDAALIRAVWPVADFIALGPEIWQAPDPAEALSALWPV